MESLGRVLCGSHIAVLVGVVGVIEEDEKEEGGRSVWAWDMYYKVYLMLMLG